MDGNESSRIKSYYYIYTILITYTIKSLDIHTLLVRIPLLQHNQIFIHRMASHFQYLYSSSHPREY